MPEAANERIEDVAVGQPLFASWVLLAPVLPIGRDYFKLAEVERGRGFVSGAERPDGHHGVLAADDPGRVRPSPHRQRRCDSRVGPRSAAGSSCSVAPRQRNV